MVIDSGYQWNPGVGQRIRSRHLSSDQRSSQAEYQSEPSPERGSRSIPDVPDANSDGFLDALAGHANFVAGVVAQELP